MQGSCGYLTRGASGTHGHTRKGVGRKIQGHGNGPRSLGRGTMLLVQSSAQQVKQTGQSWADVACNRYYNVTVQVVISRCVARGGEVHVTMSYVARQRPEVL